MRTYLFSVLQTITALSFMAAAGSTIGMWRDVSVMRTMLTTLVKDNEAHQAQYKELANQLQEHEVRLTKGNL